MAPANRSLLQIGEGDRDVAAGLLAHAAVAEIGFVAFDFRFVSHPSAGASAGHCNRHSQAAFCRCLRPSNSAICTALSAAPLRRLSLTTQMLRPLSTVGSSRTRLT